MTIRGNLAMTPGEMEAVRPLPRDAAWMSCRFSERGILDLPDFLPRGALLILEDSILPEQPDLPLITRQLEEVLRKFSCRGLLLDFQQPFREDLGQLAAALEAALPCPVALSPAYRTFTRGPIFLPLLPPHVPLDAWIRPYTGRELWLELGPAGEQITLTPAGAEVRPFSGPFPPLTQVDSGLFCHYGIREEGDAVLFTLRRTDDDLHALVRAADRLGITQFAGLYRELRGLYSRLSG